VADLTLCSKPVCNLQADSLAAHVHPQRMTTELWLGLSGNQCYKVIIFYDVIHDKFNEPSGGLQKAVRVRRYASESIALCSLFISHFRMQFDMIWFDLLYFQEIHIQK
jgi:CO dehydrogenase/acetyl-CoA synthase epsilon subunit